MNKIQDGENPRVNEKIPGDVRVLIVDTNYIVEEPHFSRVYADWHIIVPSLVIQEIDSFKKQGGMLGHNAREFTRFLGGLMQTGNLRDGVLIDNGAVVRVVADHRDCLDADEQMLKIAWDCTHPEHGVTPLAPEVWLATLDMNLRVLAHIDGIKSFELDTDNNVSTDIEVLNIRPHPNTSSDDDTADVYFCELKMYGSIRFTNLGIKLRQGRYTHYFLPKRQQTHIYSFDPPVTYQIGAACEAAIHNYLLGRKMESRIPKDIS